MSRRIHLIAATLASLLAACDPPPNPTPIWEVAVPDGGSAHGLMARGDGFCFLVTDGRDPELVVRMQCHGTDGAARWERPLNARRARLTIDAAGDVLLAASAGTGDWIVEKRDGLNGESRWLQTFRCEGGLHDLIATAGDQVVLDLGCAGLADEQDPPDTVVDGAFLVGLSSATGARLWRERTTNDATTRIAAVGDEVIVTYGDRIERRDGNGALVSSRPLAAPLFAVRSLSSLDAPTLAAFFAGDDGRLYGVAGPPALLRATTSDGDVVFDAVPGGDRDVPAVELAVGAGGVVFAGRFYGDLELGDTTLKHDENGARSSPFDTEGTNQAMPFIAVTDLDGNPRWSAAIRPIDGHDELLGVALLSADRALVLHKQDAQVRVSAFDVP